MRIKEYKDDFLSLPNPVKWTIFFIIGVIVLICVHQSVSNYAGNRKINKLEKENFELSRAANASQIKATAAEQNAANEKASRLETENKLKNLEKEIVKSDEKINSQSKKSTSARDDLRRIRVSKPANIGTERLEQRLRDRYKN